MSEFGSFIYMDNNFILFKSKLDVSIFMTSFKIHHKILHKDLFLKYILYTCHLFYIFHISF